MSRDKHARRIPTPVDDFEPFYLKEGLLWVPYLSCGKLRIHTITPAITFKGIGFALKVLGSTGNVLPFTRAAFRPREG